MNQNLKLSTDVKPHSTAFCYNIMYIYIALLIARFVETVSKRKSNPISYINIKLYFYYNLIKSQAIAEHLISNA